MPLLSSTTICRLRVSRGARKSLVTKIAHDLALGAMHGDGIGGLDEPDADLVARAVQLAFEVLPWVRPPPGEVVGDPVGSHRVEDAAQPAGLVGGLHGLSDRATAVVLAEPDLPDHPRRPRTPPARTPPSCR